MTLVTEPAPAPAYNAAMNKTARKLAIEHSRGIKVEITLIAISLVAAAIALIYLVST